MTTTINRKTFEAILEEFHENQEGYLEECKEYADSGHRHPYCFHGTSMWVDYDPMCGGCEEGRPNEYTSKGDARKFFQEWYEVDYDGDDLLGYFEPIAWGPDQVEVVKIHRYEAQRVPGKVCTMDYHNVICTLALVSDGTEFEMALATDEMRLAEEALR